MALQLNVQKFGVTIPSYCRVQSSVGSKGGVLVNAVFYPISQDVGHVYGEEEPIDVATYKFQFEADPTPQVPNVLARAYALLKTLPEFADAVDC